MKLVLLSCFASSVLALNNDVVVLVHGLGGSAETWDYRAEIESVGLETVAVEVNPFASNHDRACELYAQLKGELTDYGVCHSDWAGHERYGPDFTGMALLPAWSESSKIHLVGHSMGGLTIRHLERLLREGSGCSDDESNLFMGGNNLITSVTTIASPLDGTTIFDNVFGFQNILINQFVATGIVDEDNLEFPQWGLVREEGEDFDDFFDRVKASGLFDEEDFSIYDLNVVGAEKFNSLGRQAYDDTFYFSMATQRTKPRRICRLFFFCFTIQVPQDEMDEDLQTSARLIGRQADEIDKVNDGIVNLNRQKCPTGSGCVQVEDGSLSWNVGQWQYIEIDFLDHFQIVSRDTYNDMHNYQESARRLFLEHAVRLKNLPSSSANTEVSTTELEQVERFIEAKKEWHALDITIKSRLTQTGAIFGTISIISAMIISIGTLINFLRNKHSNSQGNISTSTEVSV